MFDRRHRNTVPDAAAAEEKGEEMSMRAMVGAQVRFSMPSGQLDLLFYKAAVMLPL
jgi:hypothetical protein